MFLHCCFLHNGQLHSERLYAHNAGNTHVNLHMPTCWGLACSSWANFICAIRDNTWKHRAHAYLGLSIHTVFGSTSILLLTGIHDQISSDFRLPVIPWCLETLSKSDAEVLKMSFTDQRLRWACRDQSAFYSQNQCWASVKIQTVIGLKDSRLNEQSSKNNQLYFRAKPLWRANRVCGLPVRR